MMAMYNNMKNMQNKTQNISFNPKKVDNGYKRTLINLNITQAKVGLYQPLPKCDCVPVKYMQGCDPGETNDICEVKVIYEHALDIAEQYAEIGAHNFTKKNKMNPAILNVVGNDFTGDSMESSEGVRDEILNLRTTFCVNPKKNAFPVKEHHCIYTPYVNVIRPKDPRTMLGWNNCYRVGLISASPIQQDGPVDKLSSSHFINTCTIIENVFQIAIGKEHQILILTPFGHEEDNNPVDDVIQIYNFCIMKYGHKFKSIIIAIPPHYPKAVFEKYMEDIIKPNEITDAVDKKYESLYDSLVIQKQIKEKLSNNNIPKNMVNNETESDDNDDSNTNNSENNKMSNQQMKNQFQMFMKMMQSNPNMMAAMMKQK